MSFKSFKFLTSRKPARQRRRRSRRVRGGEYVAVNRAFIAARMARGQFTMWEDGPDWSQTIHTDDPRYPGVVTRWRGPTQREAADVVGVALSYAVAAGAIVDAGDTELELNAKWGEIPLFAAAALVRKRAKLMKSYVNASPADRVEFARHIGTDELFTNAIVPAL
jgi:hypothetical protein